MNAERTAETALRQNRRLIDGQVEEIRQGLEGHDGSPNWRHVGDAARVAEVLAAVLAQLRGVHVEDLPARLRDPLHA